jgi:hypothetical protein
MSEENSIIRSARDIRRGLLKSAFRENRSGVVTRIQERLQRVEKETEGSKLLLSKFNFEHYPETRQDKANALIAEKEGRSTRSLFSVNSAPGLRPN